MIRRVLFFLIFLSLTRLVHGEVVLSNNTSSINGNTTLATSTTFDIGFTPTSILNYEKFFLNVNNQFGNTALTQVKLKINNGSEITWNGTVNIGTASQLIDFDISSLGQSSLSATTFSFLITGVTGDTTQTAINTTSVAGQTVTGAWNNSYSNNSGVLFQLSAVPEPGTLLLGGIAAACGGTGVWWKRRKRQPQLETTGQPAAI
jgi:hypothetical protein